MHSKEIIKRLLSEGWQETGGKGSHKKFRHPDKIGHVIVSHPDKDIPVGTLRNIYEQAGWKW